MRCLAPGEASDNGYSRYFSMQEKGLRRDKHAQHSGHGDELFRRHANVIRSMGKTDPEMPFPLGDSLKNAVKPRWVSHAKTDRKSVV